MQGIQICITVRAENLMGPTYLTNLNLMVLMLIVHVHCSDSILKAQVM